MSEGGVDHEFLNDILRITTKIIICIGHFIKYYAATIPIFAILSTRQETKIWKSTPAPLTTFGILKVFLFNIFWMGITLIGTIALLPMWTMRGFGSSVEVEANLVIEKLTAKAIHNGLIGPVKIINPHNLPPIKLHNPDSPAPIYIANHCSQLDVSAVYFALRRFKWIAKESTMYLPGAGNIMKLSGHIFIRRTGKNSKSKSNLYQESNDTIQNGVPMMFFPQGTRCMSEKRQFKDGAFKIAIENEAVLVPMSIQVPLNAWNSFYPLTKLWGGAGKDGDDLNQEKIVTITVHDPIVVKRYTDMEELKNKCEDIIYSALPPLYHGSQDKGKNGADKAKKSK
mmetsp:Transcript_7731/g.11329  ORF Transcript_7731/g.11329 Transcript_7731/m.11329 type:complete len:340 (+) Transcript_7731:138-1157(+)|eukprot:CAMPEP_0197244938 /NCGR_PEP_ID=MMETSP1429-20130617/9894_1 /TAXON_ID=49237 /ORGANISM="Chaetoceros  sp., Strain UNC1202" /LENGTH=339 /DNA_ID=CAMNT_0042705365 /DNA_START=112 /DNA_END=1131 /DNA_ORIENTATION=+